MDTPKELVAQYGELLVAQQLTKADLESQRKKILGPELVAELEALDVEYADMLGAVASRLEDLKQQIAEEVLAGGETVTANACQAVYVRGRVSWDTKKLEKLAERYPEILDCRREGDPYVTMRELKQ